MCGQTEVAGPTHVTGSKLGIDFWHAVEFSRSGRASIRPFRTVLEATLLPYQVILARSKDSAEVTHPGGHHLTPENDMIVSGCRWDSSGAPRDRPPDRCPLLPAGQRRKPYGRGTRAVKSKRQRWWGVFHRAVTNLADCPGAGNGLVRAATYQIQPEPPGEYFRTVPGSSP